jgi:hypothetical protein
MRIYLNLTSVLRAGDGLVWTGLGLISLTTEIATSFETQTPTQTAPQPHPKPVGSESEVRKLSGGDGERFRHGVRGEPDPSSDGGPGPSR